MYEHAGESIGLNEDISGVMDKIKLAKICNFLIILNILYNHLGINNENYIRNQINMTIFHETMAVFEDYKFYLI